MNNISKKIICILMVCSFIVISFVINNAYAATAEEELVQVLDEYKDDIGDIEAFGKVMDKLYQDISSATEVNDELKAKLKADVNELASVPDINPLILQILDVELKSQIENLDESNVSILKKDLEKIIIYNSIINSNLNINNIKFILDVKKNNLERENIK